MDLHLIADLNLSPPMLKISLQGSLQSVLITTEHCQRTRNIVLWNFVADCLHSAAVFAAHCWRCWIISQHW